MICYSYRDGKACREAEDVSETLYRKEFHLVATTAAVTFLVVGFIFFC